MTDAAQQIRDALEPLVTAIGGEFVDLDATGPDDVPIALDGAPLFSVRVAGLDGALERLVQRIEDKLGGPLASLDRIGKQQAIRMLEENGAFLLRKAIEDVADLMEVSRITIYNYLNATRDDPAPDTTPG